MTEIDNREPIEWFTRKEAAEYLRVSTATIDRWARQGWLHKYTSFGALAPRYRRQDLDKTFAVRGTETRDESR